MIFNNVPQLEGWEQYPENLRSKAQFQFAYNHKAYKSRLEQNAKLYLAAKCDKTLLQIIHPAKADGSEDRLVRLIKGGRQIDEYFQLCNNAQQTTVVLIPELSLRSLRISEPCLKKLLSFMEAFPPILDVVHSFGFTEAGINRSLPPVANQVNVALGTSEESWVLEYAVKHDREGQPDPWTIRFAGVYIQKQHDQLEARYQILLLNASSEMQIGLKQLVSDDSVAVNVKMIVITAITESWRPHLDALSSELEIMYSHIGHAFTDSVQFGNLRDIENLRYKACLARSAVARNIQTVTSVMEHDAEPTPKPVLSVEKMQEFEVTRVRCQTELQALLIQYDELLVRIDGALNHIRSLLSFHATEAATSSGLRTEQLQKRALKDARTLKVVTILAFIYLPATFAAGFLDTEMVTYDNEPPYHLNCKREIRIFLILTTGLLLITLSIWIGVEIWRYRKEREVRLTKPKSMV